MSADAPTPSGLAELPAGAVERRTMPAPDEHADPAAALVSLATEAALLEARLRMLREAIDTVDARIKAVTDSLRLLHRASPPIYRGRRP